MKSYTYNDCDLKPNTLYSYKVISYNLEGNASSGYTEPLFTNQSLPPEGFLPIIATQLNSTTIQIDWSKPQRTNGQLISYNIYRNSTLINRHPIDPTTKTFLDSSTLFLPNHWYEYKLYACNNFGCSSDDLNYKTVLKLKNEPPISVKPPKLLNLSDTSVILDADESILLKSTETQKIIEYRFYIYDLIVYRGVNNRFELRNLIPFTEYLVSIEACTFLPGNYNSINPIYKSNTNI